MLSREVRDGFFKAVSMNRSASHPILTIFAVLLAIAGMAISGVLLQHHVVAAIGGDPLLQAACEPTATASCDDVIASKWGRIVVGGTSWQAEIPTAWVGFAYFALVASWFLVIGSPGPHRRRLHILPTLGLLAGLAGAIGFEYVMFAMLGKYCPLCMATHVIILLLTVIALLMWRRVPARGQRDTGESGGGADVGGGTDSADSGVALPIVANAYPTGRLLRAVLLVTVATSAAGWFGYMYMMQRGYTQAYYDKWQEYDKDTRLNYERFLAQPVHEIPVYPEDPVRGPADAKYTVVLFSDFLCPACRLLNVLVDDYFHETFPGQFRVVFKHFPLDTTCNDGVKRTLHPGACSAAVAVEAVLLLEGNDAFWKMHDAMFSNQGKFTKQFAFDQAAALGISEDDYLARIQTYSAWDRIKNNIELAKSLGVDSTPVMFFNGRLLKPWGDRHMWQYLLSDETLERTPGVTTTLPSQPASDVAAERESAASTRPAAAGVQK